PDRGRRLSRPEQESVLRADHAEDRERRAGSRQRDVRQGGARFVRRQRRGSGPPRDRRRRAGLFRYNRERANQLSAVNALDAGGNAATWLLSNLDRLALQNRQAGVGVGNAALAAESYEPNRL